MFAEFDENDFPKVRVKMNSNINDYSFEKFLNTWRRLYENKKKFTFEFDTRDVGWIPIKYSYKMAIFIKNLKKKETQYLEKSIIHIYNSKVKYLLNFIFIMSKPVAPVDIYENNILIKTFLP